MARYPRAVVIDDHSTVVPVSGGRWPLDAQPWELIERGETAPRYSGVGVLLPDTRLLDPIVPSRRADWSPTAVGR